MAMSTKAKIVLAGAAAAAIVGMYAVVNNYVGVGNVIGNVAGGAKSVLGQDLGSKARGLEEELARTPDLEKYSTQLTNLFNTMYGMAPEEKKLMLARETFYGLNQDRQEEVLTGVFSGMDEQQRYAVLSGVVAGMPYTTTAQLTLAGIGTLNDGDMFKAMGASAGRIGERFTGGIGDTVGRIFGR